MSWIRHIRLFLIATVAWTGFWIIGLPAYYQQYTTTFMVWFDTLLLLLIAIVAYFALRRWRGRGRIKVSMWLAFYFTVPLAIYDWLYCAVYLGYGLHFLSRFWYLTVYYVIPWILLPSIAFMLDHQACSREALTS